MQSTQSRRGFLATLSSASAASLVCAQSSFAQEAPPETTTIRLAKIPGICIAPQYVAEELLRSEGFTNIQYVELFGQRLRGLHCRHDRHQHGVHCAVYHSDGRRLAAGAARRGARGMF